MTIKKLMELGPVLVEASCGCRGLLRPEGCRTGQYPIASVRITVPCRSGHPAHVGAGVTERFYPEQVSQVLGEVAAA